MDAVEVDSAASAWQDIGTIHVESRPIHMSHRFPLNVKKRDCRSASGIAVIIASLWRARSRPHHWAIVSAREGQVLLKPVVFMKGQHWIEETGLASNGAAV